MVIFDRRRCQAIKAELGPLWYPEVEGKVCKLQRKQFRHARRVDVTEFGTTRTWSLSVVEVEGTMGYKFMS